MFFRKKPPVIQEIETPSDILAGLITTRILADPQAIQFSSGPRWEDDPYNQAEWHDLQTKTELIAHRKNSVWNYASGHHESGIHLLTVNGTRLILSHRAKQQLLEAIDRAAAFHSHSLRSRTQFESDMAACDAIERFMTLPPPSRK